MSSSDTQNRSRYHLRPRSKLVVSIPPAVAQKISMSRQEKSRINKMIAERAKLPPSAVEGAGARFMQMTREELKKFIDAEYKASGAIHRPPKRLSDEERVQIHEKQNLRLAQTGLSYLNDPSNGDAKYELVRPIASHFFLTGRGVVYHSNFEAKLKNDPEAKTQLFFLETMDKSPGEQKVTRCCSLGLSGSKAAATGPNGCKVCLRINHPKNVRFLTC